LLLSNLSSTQVPEVFYQNSKRCFWLLNPRIMPISCEPLWLDIQSPLCSGFSISDTCFAIPWDLHRVLLSLSYLWS
jgi:hypothetical protein